MGRFDEEESGHFPDPSSCLRVGDDNEMPGLEVCSGWSPSPCLEDLEEKVIWNGSVLINPNGSSGF